ncbi:MAG: hypothetical protein BWX83_01038 [Candidatus Cloacimonetes bacterium ADurb.Bin117]|nr:MAG: hypothetical protein BWX83_01038 [Candidatus Cloacimonetes bacterium ADurb.Bin117]
MLVLVQGRADLAAEQAVQPDFEFRFHQVLEKERQPFFHSFDVDLEIFDAAQGTDDIAEHAVDIGIYGHHLQLPAVGGKGAQSPVQQFEVLIGQFCALAFRPKAVQQTAPVFGDLFGGGFVVAKQFQMGVYPFTDFRGGLFGEGKHQDVVQAEILVFSVKIQNDANVFQGKAIGFSRAGAGGDDLAGKPAHSSAPLSARKRSARVTEASFTRSPAFLPRVNPCSRICFKFSSCSPRHSWRRLSVIFLPPVF